MNSKISEMNEGRIEWMDVARGIGMLLVIIGHSRMGFSSKIVGTFHMPLFFMLAGMTFNIQKYENIKILISKKIISLGIPYVLFSVLRMFRRAILNGIGYRNYDLLKGIIGIFLGSIRNTEYDTGLWFLTCIFVVQIISYIIIKQLKNKIVILGVGVVLFIVGGCVCIYFPINLPFNADSACVALIFFLIGSVFREDFVCKRRMSYFFGALLCMTVNIFISACYTNFYSVAIGMWEDSYQNLMMFFISGCFGSLGIIYMGKIFSGNFIKVLGKNSLYFYCMHGLVVGEVSTVCKKMISYLGVSGNLVAEEVGELVFLVIVTGICWIFMPFYQKIMERIFKLAKSIEGGRIP